jgi:hypothetical protein
MQDDHYSSYREYLRKGMRIEIGIPLSAGGVFRDWALVQEGREDELWIQISRDVLPSDVRVDIGCILDVSIWVKKEVYTCSGIVVERQGGRVFKIQLFGAFTLKERRQFFRLELNMRIRYALLPSVDRNDIEVDWKHRKDLEHMKFQGYDHVVIAAQQARYRPTMELEWQDLRWSEINLGGGGLLLRLQQPLAPERLVCLEIHLPVRPARQIQTVVEVVHVMPPKSHQDGAAYYPTGVRFVFLDERDRDLIFRHISVTQIAHLRQLAEMRADGFPPQTVVPEPLTRQQIMNRILWSLFVLIVTFYLVRYLINFREAGSPNEIKNTYERSIKQYRHEGL